MDSSDATSVKSVVEESSAIKETTKQNAASNKNIIVLETGCAVFGRVVDIKPAKKKHRGIPCSESRFKQPVPKCKASRDKKTINKQNLTRKDGTLTIIGAPGTCDDNCEYAVHGKFTQKERWSDIVRRVRTTKSGSDGNPSKPESVGTPKEYDFLSCRRSRYEVLEEGIYNGKKVYHINTPGHGIWVTKEWSEYGTKVFEKRVEECGMKLVETSAAPDEPMAIDQPLPEYTEFDAVCDQ